MLVILAVIPPLAIVFAVNRYCGTERQYRKRFVLIFLIAGFLIAGAAMFGGDVLKRGAGAIFGSGVLFVLISNYIIVAFFEEVLKYAVLRWRFAKGDPFIRPLYAIALSVTVTMGFSFYEQMAFTLGEGLATVIMRAILSVPGHMAHGILMGWFLHLAAVSAAAGDAGGKKRNFRLALLVPTLTHGTYDLIVDLYNQTGSDLFILLLFAFTAGLVVYVVRLIRRVKRDERGSGDHRDGGSSSGNTDAADITVNNYNNENGTDDIPEVFYE